MALALLAVSSGGAAHAGDLSTPGSDGRVLVLPFEVGAFAEADRVQFALAYSDIAANEVRRLRIDAVSISAIRSILEAQDYLRTLEGCEGQACNDAAERLAETLRTNEILSGRIVGHADGFIVTMARLRVDTSSVVGSFEGTAGSPAAVSYTIKRGVRSLFGRGTDLGRTGIVAVESVPAGAVVTLDGRAAGVTPLTVDDLPAGAHRISLTSEAGRWSQTLYVEPGRVARIEIDLLTPPVTVALFSSPDGAEVRLDGVPVGRTPVILDDVPSRGARLRLAKEGHRPVWIQTDGDGAIDGPKVVTLRAELAPRWPVAPGLQIGAITEARAVRRGVGFIAEGTLDVSERFQVGIGGTNPPSLFGVLRAFAWRDGFELGGVLRVIASFPTAEAVADRSATIALMGGGVVGYATETEIGELGVRFEAGVSTQIAGGYAVPLILAGAWRFH